MKCEVVVAALAESEQVWEQEGLGLVSVGQAEAWPMTKYEAVSASRELEQKSTDEEEELG